MKSKIGVAAVVGLLATALSATMATAQCTPEPTYPGVMIKFDADAWAYETAYTASTSISAPGSQLTVVGLVSVFCNPFSDLNPADPNTEYTFIWDGLTSLGTVTTPAGLSLRYSTKYVGGGFRIYAGSPRNAPTAVTLPALPAPGVVPDAFVDGTMILSGAMDTLIVLYTRTSTGSFTTASFRADYWATGGTLYDRVGDAINPLTGAWCVVPQSTPKAGTCTLPAGWSAHPNGKWDTPITVPAVPSTWGKIKTLYR
jgi:hypothetical protein